MQKFAVVDLELVQNRLNHMGFEGTCQAYTWKARETEHSFLSLQSIKEELVDKDRLLHYTSYENKIRIL